MKAAVFHDFGEMSIRDIPRPKASAEEVLVKVRRVQLSVTECKYFFGEDISHVHLIREQLEQHDAVQLFGHEFCGEIVEVGKRVSKFSVGDRVYAPGKIPCSDCQFCEAGYKHHCPEKELIGFQRPGALAEFVNLPADTVRRVSSSISDAEATALQPAENCLTSVYDAGIRSGDVVVVLGSGVMGYTCGQIAQNVGAGEIYCVDIVEKKLDPVEEKGMVPINSQEEDPVATIIERTGGIGADVAFEAVGGKQPHMTDGEGAPINQCFEALRPGGKIVEVGNLIGELSIAPRKLRGKSISWIHPRIGPIQLNPHHDTGSLIVDLVASDKISISEHITDELRGLHAVEEAFELTPKDDQLGPPQIVLV